MRHTSPCTKIIRDSVILTYARFAHLGLDTATFPPPCATVNDAVDGRLQTNDPSRREGMVDRPARAGAMTKAWLAATQASRMHKIDRMMTPRKWKSCFPKSLVQQCKWVETIKSQKGGCVSRR